VAHTTPKEIQKGSRKGAARDGAGAPTSPRPETGYLAPPCPECGNAFSRELLADPEFRKLAARGEVVHAECDGTGRYQGRHARGVGGQP
jgi:hypothetical protein